MTLPFYALYSLFDLPNISLFTPPLHLSTANILIVTVVMEAVELKQLPAEQHPDLDDAQSFATVQVFLNAAVACIAHTRELIPWASSCFEKRFAGQLTSCTNETEDFYKDFCAIQTTVDDGSQEFRILKRGHDRRADNILNFIVRTCLHIHTGLTHGRNLA